MLLDGKESVPKNSFKFRAECQVDVDRFLKVLPEGAVRRLSVDPLPPAGIDRLVCIEVIDLSIEDLRGLMDGVEDGHVMAQSLALASEYTGERVELFSS